MKSYTISELVDLSTIQKLAEGHYQTTGMPIGIIDAIDGSVLVATGWQDICTSFHRAHPSSLRYCKESDNYITGHLIDGEACQYRCKNGLWDIGVPVIVAKRHLATIFLGQFFYEGETPDRDYFIRQAQRYGYNLSEYLAALDRVPVFTKEKVDGIIAYNKYFSRFMAELAERSLSNFEAEQALRDSECKFRVLTETSPAAVFLYQEEKIVYANPATAKMLGFAKEELLETRLWHWLPSNLKERVRQSEGSWPSPFECKFTTKSGEERWGYISTGWTEYQGNPASIVIIHDITKKKEAEEALQKESALLRCIIDSASDLIYIKDRDAAYLRCNKASEKFIGVSESEQIGKTDFDFFDREKAEAIQQLDRQVLAEGKALRIEEWVTDRDGGRILFDSLKSPYYGPDGEVMGLVGISRDITERKRAEEDLRESEARLKMAMDLARLAQWEYDIESGMFTFDNQFYALYGTTADREGGTLMSAEDYARKFIPAEESAVVAEGAAQVLANSSFQLEHRIIRADGEERSIVVCGEAVRDEAGCIVKARGTNQDITERKQAEEALAKSEARFRQIVDTAAEGIWVVGPDAMTTFVNSRMAEMLGCSGEEMIGRPLTDFMFEEDAPEHLRKMENRRQGTSESYERRFRHQDGRTVWTHVSATPIIDAEQHFIGSFAMFTDITEHKRAEEKLLELSQMLQLVLDNMPAFVFWKDRNSVYLGCNRLFAANAGLSSAENIFGLTDLDLPWKHDEAESYRTDDRTVMGTGVPKLNYEETQHTADGRVTWVRTSKIPLKDFAGNVIGVLGTFEDITERKRAEEALREKTEELDRYFTTALDMLCIADTDGYFRRLNPQWESTLGFSVSELEGRRFLDFVHPGDMKATLQALSRLAEQKKVLNFINRYRCKSGAYRWIEWRSYPSGTRIYAVARDITERKRAEEEIQRLKNYLANIIDSMPSILVGIDRDKAVTQWNRQAEEITGISATEAVGRPITEMLPDFSPWIKAMQSEIDRQRATSMEKLLIEKEGERRFYDLMVYPITTNGVEGAVVRIEDATERARIQELMIQTEKMMSVGGLAAGMAHEINNPLGIITQAAQNIERRVSPELPANRKAAEELCVNLEGIKAYFERRQIPEFIGSIREASLRASRIIANMLQFSRCAETTMQPSSPAGIIEQALELAASDYDLKKKFDFRSIEIIRDYAPDMPEVPMVVVEMEQVMLNLLKNAAQAMIVNPPDHGPKITLRLRREERYALIEVEDNGPGMKEEVRRRAFEPFFTTKEPGMGTGLGLSVSYMIVTQNHKGLMEVESTPGKGACFRVRLPLSKEGTHG